MNYRASELNERQLEVIAAIDLIHLTIAAHVPMPSEWAGSTSRGLHITARLAEQNRGASVELPELPPQEKGFRRAMGYMLVRAQEANFKYSDELLRALHFMLTEHDAPATPGSWRRNGGGVLDYKHNVVYRAPEADRIAELMTELIESLNFEDSAPAIIRSAMAHLNVVRIHPFRDGNGRLARCLDTLIMVHAGYRAPVLLNVEEYVGLRRVEYEAALQTTHSAARWAPESDTSAWIRFCLTMRYRQAVRLLHDFRTFARLHAELAPTFTTADGQHNGPQIAAGEMLLAPAEPVPCPGSGMIDQRAGLHSGSNLDDATRTDPVRLLAKMAQTDLLTPLLNPAASEVPDPFA
jgi:hypothetical protein